MRDAHHKNYRETVAIFEPPLDDKLFAFAEKNALALSFISCQSDGRDLFICYADSPSDAEIRARTSGYAQFLSVFLCRRASPGPIEQLLVRR